jgi:hypothetical protein
VRRALLILVAALAALTASAGTASALTVGIADQKTDMFADARFAELGIAQARLYIGWDALQSDWQRAELEAWLDAARARGVTPLVSFGHSRTSRRSLPSPGRFKYEFLLFRKRYPWVTTFATWNEANHCGEPTCHRPELVAAYWRKLRQACPRCTILPAELLDMPNMVSWVKAFRRHAKVEPKWWGLHNYVEANRFKSDRLKSLLRHVKGKVWLTEVGGIVKRRGKKSYTVKAIPESAAHARRVTTFIFDDLVPVNPRITRVYLYHWNASTPLDTWDSGLIGPDGTRRPAWWVLYRELRTLHTLQQQRR